MEKNLIQPSQYQNTPLVGKELEIVKPLFYVNLLTPFRVDDFILEQWSISINRLLPEVEPEELVELMDSFMRGETEYDNKLGIQNIFIGLIDKFPAKYYKPKMVY